LGNKKAFKEGLLTAYFEGFLEGGGVADFKKNLVIFAPKINLFIAILERIKA
jgi:hypothetical protein